MLRSTDAEQTSETLEFLLTRVLAYCLEYAEGIAFSAGIAAGDEPALTVRDLTGRIIAWIEVGAPDAARLHRASKSAARVAVYSQHHLGKLKQQLAGARVHRADAIHLFDRALLAVLVQATERRTTLSLLVTEGQLFVEIAGQSLTGVIETHFSAFLFQLSPAHRLWLDVMAHNGRARRLYESAGFVVKGTLRAARGRALRLARRLVTVASRVQEPGSR